MADEFVSKFCMDFIPPDVPPNPSDNDREKLRFILIGSLRYIRDMQLYLAYCGVAAVGDWSRLLPAPNSSELMSILVQHRMRDVP